MSEDFAQLFRSRAEILLDNHIEGSRSDCTCQRIAAICATMLAWTDAEHNLAISKDSTHRQDSARESLAEDDDIRADSVVLSCEKAPGSTESRLNLISYEKDIVLLAELITSF